MLMKLQMGLELIILVAQVKKPNKCEETGYLPSGVVQNSSL